jgi:pimeloyl-ACP methyl ester carboxylesterase
VWCHGNNGTALGEHLAYGSTLNLLAQRYTVVVADLGGNTFGNDTGVTRVGQVIDYLAAQWGSSGRAVLVGASMGAAVALNYAVRFPEKVRTVAGIIPAVDLVVPADNPAKANIDLAYPPSFSNAQYGDHNPVLFADDLPTWMPIGLWTSSNDPICYPATADAFVAARPQTHRVDIGPRGHAGVNLAAADVAGWLADH